ncbi:hypothetical protein Q3G72_024525 [Acer saccharum]|nr:hypothetical protein Q3G72_024525 [Acer saccharum]
MKDLEFGRWIRSYIEQNGIKMDLTLSNAMLDMYVKCGSVEDAKKMFDKMEEKDIVSWTTMIDGYAKLGEYDVAKSFLDAIPRQETATRNALISAYDQNRKPQEALAIFRQLQLSKNANPDELTFVSTLSSCAQLGAMDVGEWIHENIKKQRMKLNCHLTTSLIDILKGSNISSLGISQNSRRLSVQRNVKRTKDDLLGKHSEEVAFSEIEGDATNVNICRVFVLGVPRRFFGDWPFSTGGIGHIPPAATQQECKPG